MSIKIETKTLILALLSALWAFIPILTSYSANLGEVGLDFVLLFGLVCAIGTVVIFSLFTWIFHSPFAGFGACVVGWFGVSASYSVITGLVELAGGNGIPGITPLYCVVLLVVALGVGWVIKKLVARYKPDEKFVLTMVAVLVGVLLVVSAVPIVTYSIQSAIAESEMEGTDMEFFVDEDLPHPNIYWIHAESMVNEKILEKYWGEETVGFTEALEERGFYVNQDAEIIVSPHTTYVHAALRSPNYYDIYEEYYLSEYVEGEWNPDTKIGQIYSIAIDTYRHKNELHKALSESGYITSGILSSIYYDGSEFQNYYIVSNDYSVYRVSNPSYDIYETTGEIDNDILFIMYTAYPLYSIGNIFNIWETYKEYAMGKLSPDALERHNYEEILEGTDWLHSYGGFLTSFTHALNTNLNPKFISLYPSFAHEGYRYDDDGNYQSEKFEYRLYGYYEQYLLSEKIILYLVEMIQENDPNALIIIQGDHGPHVLEGDHNVKEFYDTFGPDANVVELRNHVLSAVYIPEEYQTEDYKEILSNPLNIARYLVNNFVGENYEYK